MNLNKIVWGAGFSRIAAVRNADPAADSDMSRGVLELVEAFRERAPEGWVLLVEDTDGTLEEALDRDPAVVGYALAAFGAAQ